MSKNSTYKLNIWLPASIILTGIGILTLITPFFETLSTPYFILDMISGSVLAILGIIGFIYNSRKR